MIAYAAKGLAVENLAAAAAVGVSGLLALRQGAVYGKTLACIRKLRRKWIESGFQGADHVEANTGRNVDPDTGFGLFQAAFSHRRLRAGKIARRGESLILQATGQ